MNINAKLKKFFDCERQINCKYAVVVNYKIKNVNVSIVEKTNFDNQFSLPTGRKRIGGKSNHVKEIRLMASIE